MEKPLVSICLFAYNQEKYIKEAIRGVLNQTYENLGIIISDDCSTDNTYVIIKEEVEKYKGIKTGYMCNDLMFRTVYIV